jgi:hypothetical protein
MKSSTASSIKAIAISSVLAFIGVAITMAMALFVSPVFSAVFASLPLTLFVWALSATMTQSRYQQEAFNRSLPVVVAMYFALTFASLAWALLHLRNVFKTDSFSKSVWKSFGTGMSVWFAATIVLLLLYFTVPSFHKRFESPEHDDDDDENIE